MSDRIPCYIPSYMRSGNVLTLDTIPHHLLKPILVVHDSERKTYAKKHPKVKVISTPDRGIGLTRQFICDHARHAEEPVIAMLDDDITGWLWKAKLRQMGTVRSATREERDSRWAFQIQTALEHVDEKKGYAIAFTYRFALAAPRSDNTPVSGVRIGLVNECMLLNRKAIKTAQFTLETAEDVQATLHWLTHGVIAGQDWRLGHTAPITALTAERGGCGEYREGHPDFHLRNHRRVWKMFPDFVSKPLDKGTRRHDGMVQVTTKFYYMKAAKAGGLV